ncbi:NADH:ubiquinone oxidoreductase, partial [Tulasnella sp. 417]
LSARSKHARSPIIQSTRYVACHKERRASVYETETLKVDSHNKQVTLNALSDIKGDVNNMTIPYDIFVHDVGADTRTFGIPGIEGDSCFLKELPDAEERRECVMDCIESAAFPDQSEEEVDHLIHMSNRRWWWPHRRRIPRELHDFIKDDLRSWYPELAEKLKITASNRAGGERWPRSTCSGRISGTTTTQGHLLTHWSFPLSTSYRPSDTASPDLPTSPWDVFRDLPPDPQPDYSTDASVSKGPSAAQASRRAKNAAHRQDDVKFAYDIGTSRLTEVRRLQSLLRERDKTIQDMKADKDDLEKENDLLRTNLRQQEMAADRFKEENWNLEVKIQEAQAALSETQKTSAQAESELKQTTRQLTQAREAAENHKSEHEKVTAAYEEFKTKHDRNVAQMRKQAAALTCEKSDLQASLDAMKTEMAKRERKIGKNRFGSLLANNNPPAEVSTPANHHNNEDMFASALASRRNPPGSATPGHAYDFDTSPEPSPTKPGIQALAHAHRQIGTLKNTIQREKEQKLQFKKQLAKEGLLNASVPGAWEDEEADEQDDVETSPPRAAPSTRGRSKDVQSPPTSPPGNRDLLDEEVEGGHDVEPSPFVVPSHPTSVDGMDPAFANVLKQMPGGSPVRPSPLAGQRDPVSPSPQPTAAGKKSRGGPAFKRPDSLAGPGAGSLGVELGVGIGDESVDNTTLQQPPSANPEEPLAPIIAKEVVKEVVTVEVPVCVEVPVPVPVVKPETAGIRYANRRART